jgi:hypothetical protein
MSQNAPGRKHIEVDECSLWELFGKEFEVVYREVEPNQADPSLSKSLLLDLFSSCSCRV